MYAVTDGCSGLSTGWDMPGSGQNFLLHNMVRSPPLGWYFPALQPSLWLL